MGIYEILLYAMIFVISFFSLMVVVSLVLAELSGLCNGYWYFKDRNTDDHSPSGAARNYTIAVYDLGTKQFYYYEYDS